MRERQYRSKPHAPRLRRETTRAETLLWQRLRRKQLGYKFRRQHPVDDFILDFACISEKLGVELDGSIHQSENAQARDELRSLKLRELGWSMIRFTNADVIFDATTVIADIRRRLPPPTASRPPPP